MGRLQQILDELHEIQRQLDRLEKAIRENKPMAINVSESKLLTLPDHLRTTFMAVAAQGECTASHVALITTRARAAFYFRNKPCYAKDLAKQTTIA